MHFPELYLIMSTVGPLLAAVWEDTQCLRAKKMRLHMRGRSSRFRSRYTVRLCLHVTVGQNNREGVGLHLLEHEIEIDR
jgi:hypothetical protein